MCRPIAARPEWYRLSKLLVCPSLMYLASLWFYSRPNVLGRYVCSRYNLSSAIWPLFPKHMCHLDSCWLWNTWWGLTSVQACLWACREQPQLSFHHPMRCMLWYVNDQCYVRFVGGSARNTSLQGSGVPHLSNCKSLSQGMHSLLSIDRRPWMWKLPCLASWDRLLTWCCVHEGVVEIFSTSYQRSCNISWNDLDVHPSTVSVCHRPGPINFRGRIQLVSSHLTAGQPWVRSSWNSISRQRLLRSLF